MTLTMPEWSALNGYVEAVRAHQDAIEAGLPPIILAARYENMLAAWARCEEAGLQDIAPDEDAIRQEVSGS